MLFHSTLATLFTCKYPEMKWVARPSTAYYLPPTSCLSRLIPSSFACLILHPPRCNFTPVLLSEPPPLPSSFSTSSLPTDQGCRLLDYAGLGSQISNTRDESVQTGMRGRKQWRRSTQAAPEDLYLFIYTDGEKGNFTKRPVRDGVWTRGDFREADSLQAKALTTFTRQI